MFLEQKVEKICDKSIDNEILTRKMLRECGLSKFDVKSFVTKKILEKIKYNQYKLYKVDYLYNYSKNLSISGFSEKATLGFLKCYELNPNHSNTCFELFIRSLINEDYDSAFEYFDKFYETDDELLNKYNQFFLYMLNIITEIPDKYSSELEKIKLSSIKFNDERIEETDTFNKLRYYSINNKYSSALNHLNEKQENQGHLSMIDLISKILLERINVIFEQIEYKVLTFIKNEDYDSLIKLLQENPRICSKDLYQRMIYLATVAKKIIETAEIPEVNNVATSDFDEAIQNNNFALALQICTEYDKKENIPDKENWIYLVLEKVVFLINELNISSKYINQNESKVELNEESVLEQKILFRFTKRIEALRKVHGISITKSMIKEKRDELFKEIAQTPDISAIEMGLSDSKQIVLIYTPKKNESLDVIQILKEAKSLYNQQSYKKALEKYFEILETGKTDTYIFAKIGLSYLKLNKIKKSIEYLNIATVLSQQFNEDFDFTELIRNLKGSSIEDDNEVKPKPKITM